MDLVLKWNAILKWLTKRPDGMSEELARLYAVGRSGYPVGVLLHGYFVALFWYLDLWVLVYFNIASVVLWAVSTWRLYKFGEVRWTFIACTMIEIPAHGVLATYYLGTQSGFFLYVLSSVIMTVLATFIDRRLRIVFSFIYMAILVASGTASIYFEPAVVLTKGWNIYFFALNAASLAMMLGGFMALYEWIASIAEKNLISSHRRTESANQSLEAVSSQLAKYISPQLYQMIINGEQEVKVDSRRKKLTVFFSDIAGFTETTDQLQSEELTSLLNQYLTEMSKIAREYGANFDKFIGDAIVLYFGDPETLGVKEDASQCVRMAIAMQQRMHELQNQWRDLGLERPFQLRIGINTGYCTVGNFGSEDRMDYTIIGGEVNLAARLESHSDVGGILLANETHSLVKDWLMADKGEAITVKGFANPVTTYKVKGIYDDLAAEGRIIHHADATVSLTIDREQLDKPARKKAIQVLEKAIAELRNP